MLIYQRYDDFAFSEFFIRLDYKLYLPNCLLQRKLKVVTIFGAGLLVGTALTVIIPEGVNSLYSQPHKKEVPTIGKEGQAQSEPVTTENGHTEEYSSTIGLSLVLGFVFMMVVDQISSRTSHEIHGKKSATATIGLVVHAAGKS